MKFWNRTWLCFAIYDIEVHIMLNLIRIIKVWEKFNFNVAVKCESLFSGFYEKILR